MSTERPFISEPLDERLARVVFQPDAEPHIMLDPAVCARCRIERVCVIVCPAGNYRYGEADHRMTVSAESCMECGACRIACTEGAITWRWPRGGFGVCYVRS
jgi:ferredoxin like protein